MHRDGEVEIFTIKDCRYKVETTPNTKNQEQEGEDSEEEPEPEE